MEREAEESRAEKKQRRAEERSRVRRRVTVLRGMGRECTKKRKRWPRSPDPLVKQPVGQPGDVLFAWSGTQMNIGHQSAGGNSSWCPKLESQTTPSPW